MKLKDLIGWILAVALVVVVWLAVFKWVSNDPKKPQVTETAPVTLSSDDCMEIKTDGTCIPWRNYEQKLGLYPQPHE